MGNKQSREAVSRKRGRGELVDGESDAVVTEGSVDADECDDSKALSPKRKRIDKTSSYIYNTLFEKSINSDITIHALGTEWKLHKLYLSQSPYFDCMFNGSWMESSQTDIVLDIPDDNVDVEALGIAFGSLYKDSVCLNMDTIGSTLAAASLFQMDGLQEHCAVFMRENLNAKNVNFFLRISSTYGLSNVVTRCWEWLEMNSVLTSTVELLRDMTTDTITQLIQSNNLFVMQVEMDIYSMAKKWLFLQCCSTWSGPEAESLEAAETHFRDLSRHGSVEFLLTEVGQPFQSVFESIRYQYIINDSTSAFTVEEDGIVPKTWILPIYRQQWLKMLALEQASSFTLPTVSLETFESSAQRCGRVLTSDTEYCWRWTGYSFSFDLLLLYDKGVISVKRNTKSQPCYSSVSLKPLRSIHLRLRVMSMRQEEVISRSDTGMVAIALKPDEEHVLCTLSSEISFPLYVGISYLLQDVSL